MKSVLPILFLNALLVTALFAKKEPSATEAWRSLLKERPDCVTWVSATVKVEINSGGRSYPPREEKLEALGTVLSAEGLVTLSLSKVDPTASILSRMRSPGSTVNVNYSEVNVLMPDGSEVPARLILKDSDLDLAFLLPLTGKNEGGDEVTFQPVPEAASSARVEPLDEVVTFGKLSRNLYRQSSLLPGRVNAVIRKPRDYYVVDRSVPGSPVFDAAGKWLGVCVYKMASGRPTTLVTLPAADILEIAEQAKERSR